MAKIILLIPLFYVTFVYQRLLFDPPNTILEETIAYEVPPLISVYKALARGEFLLWDNKLGAGTPAIGHPMYQQTNPLIYPLVLAFKDNAIMGMRIYFFIHLLIAAYSFFFLCRYLKLNQTASFLGMTTYLGTYYILVFTMQAAFRPDLLIMVYLPLVFLLLLKAVDKKDTGFAIFAGAVFSLLIHSGALHFSIIGLLTVLIFFTVYSLIKLSGLMRSGLTVLIFLLFAFGFSAIKAVPVIEFLQNSPRRELTLVEAEQGIDLAQYKTILQTSVKNFVPTHAYVVVGFFVMIGISLVYIKKPFFLATVLTALLVIIIAGGRSFPIDLYEVFYKFVPSFRSMRNSTRFLVYLWFVLPLLFSFGINHLLLTKTKLRSVLKATLIILAIILIYQQRKIIDGYEYPRYVVSDLELTLKKLKDIEIEPFRVAGDFSALELNRAALPAYSYTTYLIDNFDTTINVYNDVRPYYYDSYHIPEFDKLSTEKLENWHTRYSVANVKYLVVPDRKLPQNNFFKYITGKTDLGARVVEVVNTRSRFSFIPKTAGFQVNSFNETSGKLDIDFTTDTNGVFVYSNVYFPGWEANLNGQRVGVLKIDGMVKGVIIPSMGDYKLKLVYRPKTFYYGLLITSMTTILACCYFFRTTIINPFEKFQKNG